MPETNWWLFVFSCFRSGLMRCVWFYCCIVWADNRFAAPSGAGRSQTIPDWRMPKSPRRLRWRKLPTDTTTGKTGPAGDGSPYDRLLADAAEIFVGAREVAAAEKSAVDRERRRVYGLEDEIPLRVCDSSLFLGVTAPKHVYDALFAFGDRAYHGVGEGCLLYTSPSPRDRG